MRYSSVLCTVVVPRRLRRRLAFLDCARWRLPALERRTFPLAVSLNRLITDFFVLMPLGRRINQFLLFKKSAQYTDQRGDVQVIILGVRDVKCEGQNVLRDACSVDMDRKSVV